MSSFLTCITAISKFIKPNVSTKILAGCLQRSCLHVQENVAYTLLNEANIPTPKFGLAKDPKEAMDIAKKMKTKNLVVKAQVLVDGCDDGTFTNGFKGGVKTVNSPQKAKEIAEKMIGQSLVTKATGPEGLPCTSVMVAQRKFPSSELYFAIKLDPALNGPVLIASSQGGANIEEVAAGDPEAVIVQPIDIKTGLTKKQAEQIVEKIGLECKSAEKTVEMLLNMYCLFIEKDALLVELNPYAEDAVCESEFFVQSAKLLFDDSAEFRQEELFALRDWTQENPQEAEAAKLGLNYIPLNGNIGCIVNGGGLVMSTMDLIKHFGGEPENFLNLGGAATTETIKEGIKTIACNPKVNCILVNIFGGILSCEVVAEGVIEAATELELTKPIVCRLNGTKFTEARELITESGLPIIQKDNFNEAAKASVSIAKIIELAKAEKINVTLSTPECVE